MFHCACLGHNISPLPPREDIQGFWSHRPEAFPVCLDWHHRILDAELHLLLYCHYCCTTLGYSISQWGEKAWVFYKWACSAIDEIEYLHSLYFTFEHEPMAKPESRIDQPMTTWDGLDEEVKHLPLV